MGKQLEQKELDELKYLLCYFNRNKMFNDFHYTIGVFGRQIVFRITESNVLGEYGVFAVWLIKDKTGHLDKPIMLFQKISIDDFLKFVEIFYNCN